MDSDAASRSFGDHAYRRSRAGRKSLLQPIEKPQDSSKGPQSVRLSSASAGFAGLTVCGRTAKKAGISVEKSCFLPRNPSLFHVPWSQRSANEAARWLQENDCRDCCRSTTLISLKQPLYVISICNAAFSARCWRASLFAVHSAIDGMGPGACFPVRGEDKEGWKPRKAEAFKALTSRLPAARPDSCASRPGRR